MEWVDNSNIVTLPIMESISVDCTTPYLSGNNRCTFLLNDDESPKFSKAPCKSKKKFICQIDKARFPFEENNFEEIFNSSSCPDGYYGIDKTCYKFHPEEKVFDEAEIICRTENTSHLTSVESYTDNVFLQMLMIKNNVTNTWLGLKMKHTLHQGAKPVHYWNDGNPVFDTKWTHSNVTHFSVEEIRCALLNKGSLWSWNLASCDKKLPFICKLVQKKLHISTKLRNTFCPGSWYAFNGSCYYIHEEQDTSWQGAVEKCILLDSRATLGSVYTTMEKQAIKYFLDNQNDPGLWTGTFVTKGGMSMNIGGSELINEALEKPNERDKEKNCAKLSLVYGRELLNWDRCDEKYGFVCKMESLQHPETLLSNTTSEGCPDRSWIRREEYCYRFLPDQFLTWNQAERMCTMFGEKNNNSESHLASIQDSLENHFIQVLLYQKTKLPFQRWTWIGYNTGYQNKTGWTDGQEMEYENWSKSNLLRTGTFCTALETTTGIWKNKGCDEQLEAVCKIHSRDQEETSTASTTATNVFNNTISSSDQITTTSLSNSSSEVYASPDHSTNSSDKQTMGNTKKDDGSGKSGKINDVVIAIVIVLVMALILVAVFIILKLKRVNFLPCKGKLPKRNENKAIVDINNDENIEMDL